MIRSRGHCNTMGTASTMALVAEALGTVVPGVAGRPAADSRLLEELARDRSVGRGDGRCRPAAKHFPHACFLRQRDRDDGRRRRSAESAAI